MDKCQSYELCDVRCSRGLEILEETQVRADQISEVKDVVVVVAILETVVDNVVETYVETS